jgi:Fic family protein
VAGFYPEGCVAPHAKVLRKKYLWRISHNRLKSVKKSVKPAMLPPVFTITPEMLRIIAELDEFKGQWRMIRSLSPEKLTSLRRVATIESVGSSTRIEGSKLTDLQVEDLLGRLHITEFRTRDEQEVAGYAYVMDEVFDAFEQIPVSENMIGQLHQDLLRYSVKDERHRGHYKTLANHVAAFDADGKEIGIVFQTSSPFDTPRDMENLVAWFTKADRDRTLHPLLLIGSFIVVFLAIHPFQDGNGRLSRVLTTLMLLRAGYAHVPYSSLESVIETTKEGYYRALRRTQTTLSSAKPDWEAWLLFFLRSLVKQKDALSKKIFSEDTHADDLNPLGKSIVALLPDHETLTLRLIVALTGGKPSTVKLRLKELVEKGYLLPKGQGRGVYYVRRPRP